MSKTSWILSAMALAAALNQNTVQAQPPAAPLQLPAQPAMTAAPTVNVEEASSDNGGRRGTGIIADVGYMYLTPTWKNNPALTTFVEQPNGTGGEQDVGTHTDLDFGYQVVPQISLGWIGTGGLGFRTSWWGFARSSSLSRTVPAEGTGPGVFIETADPLDVGIETDNEEGVPATMSINARLRMSVWDFEALRDIQGGQWDLLLSAGVRYAHIGQDYQAVANPNDEGAGFLSALVSGHNFNGAGPTLALNGRWYVGSTNLYLYGNARASLLFGRTKQSVAEIFQFNNDQVGIDTFSGTSNSDKTTMPVLEGGIGAGWSRAVRNMLIFVEAGLVGQSWFDAGNTSRSDGAGDGASISDDNLGLVGYTVRFGVNY